MPAEPQKAGRRLGQSVPHKHHDLRLVRGDVPIVEGTQSVYVVTAACDTDTPSQRTQCPGRCCRLMQER